MDTARVQVNVVRGADSGPLAVEFGQWIAGRNADSRQHIGYLGTEPDDITAELVELGMDCVYATAELDSRRTGLLCLAWDPAVGRTWLYGPWADTAEVMDRLYGVLRPEVPSGVPEHEVFCDSANAAVVAFAGRNGLRRHGDHVILRFARERLAALPPVELPELTPDLHPQVAALHDRAFPNTYMPSAALLASPGPILVAADGGTLLGYVALRLRPEFHDAQIEYVAVAESARGRGTGARLVAAALHRAFADPRFDAMDLVTGKPEARRLYERVGFTLRREMLSFRTPV